MGKLWAKIDNRRGSMEAYLTIHEVAVNCKSPVHTDCPNTCIGNLIKNLIKHLFLLQVIFSAEFYQKNIKLQSFTVVI
jgi:hypothetical protein